MCHLILFLPAFAMTFFWVIPFKAALPLYLFILGISFFLYFKVFQAMHQGVMTGMEAMLKKKAIVIEDINPEGKIQYASEIWHANGEGKRFIKGGQVLIKKFRGLSLIVGELPLERDTI